MQSAHWIDAHAAAPSPAMTARPTPAKHAAECFAEYAILPRCVPGHASRFSMPERKKCAQSFGGDAFGVVRSAHGVRGRFYGVRRILYTCAQTKKLKGKSMSYLQRAITDGHPNLATWFARLSARPSVRAKLGG